MQRVLERLRATSAVEAAAKLHALRRVRAAFVWSAQRSGAAAEGSSAVDHLLSAACSAAQELTIAASNRSSDVLAHQPNADQFSARSAGTGWELHDTGTPVGPTPDGFDLGAAGRLKIGGPCVLA